MKTSSVFTVADQIIMSEAKNYFRWQYNLVEPFLGQSVLEIGCGIGNFTALMNGRACRVLGIDIDKQCIEFNWRRFAELDHIQALLLDVMSPEIEELKDFGPDTIICLNVLEHIQNDAKALGQMFNILRPGGKVCLIVPAFEALRGPIDNALGHYRRYTLQGLRELSSSVGFDIVRLHYMNIVGFIGWWLNSKVFKRTSQSPFQIRAFDRFIVPILSRVERIVLPPFGQNIFAVLKKPEDGV